MPLLTSPVPRLALLHTACAPTPVRPLTTLSLLDVLAALTDGWRLAGTVGGILLLVEAAEHAAGDARTLTPTHARLVPRRLHRALTQPGLVERDDAHVAHFGGRVSPVYAITSMGRATLAAADCHVVAGAAAAA